MEGENKWSPLPINLQRHVYHPMLGNSDEQDFFNLEKALQITRSREANLSDPMDPPGTNIVFQSPRKWLKQYTREGPRIVSCTKVSTFICFKKNDKWSGRNLGLTYACFHCDKNKGLLDLKLTKESQEGDLQDLLNGPKRKAGTTTGSVFGDLLAAMKGNMRPPADVLEQMEKEGKSWYGTV